MQNNLKNKRIIITGCGYKPVRRVFKDLTTKKPTHTELTINGEKSKLNVGSSIALSLVETGATIHIVSRTEKKLKLLKKAISEYTGCDKDLIEYSAVDLLDEKQVKAFVKNLPKDKPVYWVQSVGLGAGSYKVKDDNPYLPLEKIDVGLLEAESRIVLRGTHLLMQQLLPIFKKQKETKIAVITSLSATRGYSLGGAHCSAKGAIDRYVNSATLGLNRYNIFVTAVRPGIVDTGMYDVLPVINAVKRVGKEYGWDYKDNNIPLSPPISVGNVVREILSSSAHITSINMVANKQWSNEAS